MGWLAKTGDMLRVDKTASVALNVDIDSKNVIFKSLVKIIAKYKVYYRAETTFPSETAAPLAHYDFCICLIERINQQCSYCNYLC